MARLSKDSNIINTKIYKLIEPAIKTKENSFKNNIAKFLNDRHELVYAIAPYDRIYFNQTDVDNFFKSIGIEEKQVLELMKETVYYNYPNNPQCGKEPISITLFCIIRYFLKVGKYRFAELACIYLLFTGKYYSSLHGLFWQKFPPNKYPEVMDFVVNNSLSNKFSLKSEGTVYGAIRSMSNTYLNTYEKLIKADSTTDNQIAGPNGLLQQLRDREKDFLKNIAKEYYAAFENRNYLNYETDDYSEDNFRLADNDTAKARRVTDNVMNYITSNTVSLELCNKCKNEFVKATEIKDIIETILSDNKNLPEVARVVNILICDFLMKYPKGDLGSIDFISYSIKLKPNTKEQHLIEKKQIILGWLDESSAAFRKRKHNLQTANGYLRSIELYLVLIISKVAKR